MSNPQRNNNPKLKFIGTGPETVQILSNVICGHIPINEMLMREHFRRSIIEWEKKTSNSIKTIPLLAPTERIEYMDEILDELSSQLLQNLQSKHKKQKIDLAIDKGRDYYVDILAHQNAIH